LKRGENTMTRINEEHIISIDGRPYVKYAGLLEAAHRSGLRDLQVKLIQSPTKDNGYTAVCEATAVIKTRNREKVYIEIGDANPASIGDPRLSVHAIRIAATRAKARALRDALRISICSVEELALGGPQPEVSKARTSSETQSQDKPRKHSFECFESKPTSSGYLKRTMPASKS